LHLHVCTHFFTPYSLFHPLSPKPLPHFPWLQPYPLCRTCSALLVSYFAEDKRKRKKTWHFC
jgi:hypothetical protein